tara:strand:- start:63 stop:287 length:225 start_codon:yes stop_codon:yes gene_type:complete
MAEIHIPNSNIQSISLRESLIIYEALKNYRISLNRLSDLNKSNEVGTLIAKVKGKKWIIFQKENPRTGVNVKSP